MPEPTIIRLLPQLFLRAPFYSYALYDLRRMLLILQDPAFRNAVFLASPSLYNLLEQKGFDWSHLSEKERHTLRKYYNRMSYRPTPFGSFATFTLMDRAAGGGVELATNDRIKLHLQPDEQLRKQAGPGSDDTDFCMLNPLLYRLGKDYRFIRSTDEASGKNNFFLDTLKADPFYIRLFRIFRKGLVPAGVVLDRIIAYGACTKAEARDHLNFLISHQVLFTPEKGAIIGGTFNPEGDTACWQKIKTMENPEIPPLSGLVAGLRTGMPRERPLSNEQFFYAAAERPFVSGGPAPNDITLVERALQLLQRFSVPGTPSALTRFKKSFIDRFDRQKVPLLEALDPDAGIDYEGMAGLPGTENILKDLPFPGGGPTTQNLEWTAAHRLLFHRWKAAGRDPYAPLELTEAMLDDAALFPAADARFPNTSGVLFRCCGDKLVLEQSGGPTGTALIGRFSVFSEGSAALGREIASLEAAANPGVLFADIGQFSDRHTDNINRRQQIYPYEIPLNVFSALPAEMQLLPGDLLLSVQQGELVLESARLKKRVVPRLSTAFNHYHNELGIFRFLCDLQYQGLHSAQTIDLERFFPGMRFYPRVSGGKVVFCTARWKIGREEMSGIQEGLGLDGLTGLERLCRDNHLPPWISFGHYDQQLVFNLADRQDAAFFLDCIKGLTELTVTEYLLPDREITAGHLPLAGQYLGFLHQERQVYPSLPPLQLKKRSRVPRSFPPGSNWLYLKIYCTPQTSNRVLDEIIRPVLRDFHATIDRWFFIRYTDPGYHLRLRIRVIQLDGGKLLAGICRQFRKSGHEQLIHTLQGDTYQRELERYGVELIDLAEEVFRQGSDLALSFLHPGDHGQASEFSLGFAAASQMILTVMNTDEAIAFASDTAKKFLEEFKADKNLRINLDRKFRMLQGEMAEHVGGNPAKSPFWGMLSALRALADAAVQLPDTKRQELWADLIHMQLNRTFRTDQRKQELLVWYCLSKHFRSLKARKTRA